MPEFDPYREWLDIDPAEQPADHYRLLGLARFETSPSKIEQAADERMAHVRQFQTGKRGPLTQKLLNELAAARLCLSDLARKAQYDADLAQRISALEAARRASVPPPPPPVLPPVPLVSAPFASSTIARKPQTWQSSLIIASWLVALFLAVSGWAIGRLQSSRSTSSVAIEATKTLTDQDQPKHVVAQQSPDGEIAFETRNWPAGAEDSAEAAWPFHVHKPGFFQAEVTYATGKSFGEGALELQINDRRRRLTLRNTGGLSQFETDVLTVAVPRSGQHTLTVRLVGKIGPDDLIVRGIRFVPVERDTTP